MKHLDKNGRELKVGDEVRACQTYADYTNPRKGIIVDYGHGLLILIDEEGDCPIDRFRNGDTEYYSLEII